MTYKEGDKCRYLSDVEKICDNIAGTELVDDYTLKIKGDAESGLSDIMRFVLQNNIAVEKIERCENTLENLFMEVVSK